LNPIEALIFFRLLPSNCINWKIYCDDHFSLSSTTAVQKFIRISYISQSALLFSRWSTNWNEFNSNPGQTFSLSLCGPNFNWLRANTQILIGK